MLIVAHEVLRRLRQSERLPFTFCERGPQVLYNIHMSAGWLKGGETPSTPMTLDVPESAPRERNPERLEGNSSYVNLFPALWFWWQIKM